MVTRTRFVESSGARFAVDIDGDGPPRVLFCQGGPGSPDDFAELRALLAELAIPCARFDQRVFRSVNLDGTWDLEAYASDVEVAREALGVDRLVVFGHSWGGVVARAWAKAHPDRVRGVLLASPSAVSRDSISSTERTSDGRPASTDRSPICCAIPLVDP